MPTTNADGSRTYVPAGGAQSIAYRISGSVYHVVITGSTTFNAAGVFGRLVLRGKGTLTINGRKNRWNGPPIKLCEPPKARQAALPHGRGGHAAARTKPVPPPPTAAVTTVTTVPASG